MSKSRILFFDLLRIVAISTIVLIHVLAYTGHGDVAMLAVPGTGIGIFFILGISNFLFVSGCVLAYSYTSIRSPADYGRFMAKRLLRLYPAYWCSLLFAIGLNLLFFLAYGDFRLRGLTPWDYLLSFSGFQAFFGQWGGRINEVGWFIGLIVCLYLLYPLLDQAFSKSRYGTLFALFAIGISSQVIIRSIDPVNGYLTARWFPVCHLFDFGLGIFIVRAGLYPKTMNGSRAISLLSDLGFYVFLVHLPLLYLIRFNLLFFLTATLAVAYLFYRLDAVIKARLAGFFAGLAQGMLPTSRVSYKDTHGRTRD